MVRVKKRHCLFKLNNLTYKKTGNDITCSEIYTSIKSSVLKLYGLLGNKYLASFQIKYFNIYTNIGYFSCLREYHRKILAALNFVNQIGKFQCNFRSLHVGGTIKNCQRFLVKYHAQSIKGGVS